MSICYVRMYLELITIYVIQSPHLPKGQTHTYAGDKFIGGDEATDKRTGIIYVRQTQLEGSDMITCY